LAVVGECLEVVTIPDFIPVGVALVVLAKKEVFRGGVIPVLPGGELDELADDPLPQLGIRTRSLRGIGIGEAISWLTIYQ